MDIHFRSGRVLTTTEISQWPSEHVLKFAHTINNFGTALEIRCCCAFDGGVQFVHFMTVAVDFIALSETETVLLETAIREAAEKASEDMKIAGGSIAFGNPPAPSEATTAEEFPE